MCSSSATRRTPFGFAWVCPVHWCTGTISRCALGNLLSVKSRSRIQGVFGDRGTDGTRHPVGMAHLPWLCGPSQCIAWLQLWTICPSQALVVDYLSRCKSVWSSGH